MKMRLLLFMGVFLASPATFSQRFSAGYHYGFSAMHRTILPGNYIFPPYSYFIYHTANSKKDGAPIWDNSLNGYALGFNFNLDYKRFTLTSELTIGQRKTKIPLTYPMIAATEQTSTFRTTEIYFSTPLLLTYKVTRKANGPFIMAGVKYNFITTTEENSFTDDMDLALQPYLTDVELYGVIWNEWNYPSFIVGAGIERFNNYISIRLSRRFGGELWKYPTARFFTVDLQVSKSVSFQSLKKGYHIFID
jgi:hypothetical protein